MNNTNTLFSPPTSVKNLGFGCVALTSSQTESHALKLLETAFAGGIVHYDTAPLYGQGYSEKILAKFIKRKREKLTITTKFALSPLQVKRIPAWMALPLNSLRKKLSGKQISPNRDIKSVASKLAYRKITLAQVERDLQKSLQRLKTDYIDYYILHEGMPSFLEDGAYEFLYAKKETGIIKHIGLGCDFINFKDEIPEIFKGWDVLQYGCENILNKQNLVLNFPDLLHFQHSIFKNINKELLKGKEGNNIAGAALALAVMNNPTGKVLFSTSNQRHLENNLKSFDKHIKLHEKELTKTLSNAFY